MIFKDPNESHNFFKFKLYPNFNMTGKASLFWVISNCDTNTDFTLIYTDERGRELKKNQRNIFVFLSIFH